MVGCCCVTEIRSTGKGAGVEERWKSGLDLLGSGLDMLSLRSQLSEPAQQAVGNFRSFVQKTEYKDLGAISMWSII